LQVKGVGFHLNKSRGILCVEVRDSKLECS
jgi:hypothetical protein